MNVSRWLPLMFITTLAAAAPHPAEVPVVRPPVLRSLDYRQDARYQLTLGLGSLHPYIGFSVNAAYFLEPSRLLTASYTEGTDTKDFLVNFFSAHNEDAKARMITFGYKHFFLNSLYLEGSFFARRVSQAEYDYDTFSNYADSVEYSMDSLGGIVALGNQWQWPTFTLGCDWVGGVLPLAHSTLRESRRVAESLTLSYEKKDFEQSVRDSRLLLLRFYLGYSF